METENNAPSLNEGLAQQVRRGRRRCEDTSGPQREPEGRAERVPLGVRRPKLLAENRPGYVLRWINDDGDRIQSAIRGGWDFVLRDKQATSDDAGNRISKDVGSKVSGQRLNAYLMEIREDWYKADQAEKQEKIDATEALIKRGELTQKIGSDGAYIPKQGIRITRA